MDRTDYGEYAFFFFFSHAYYPAAANLSASLHDRLQCPVFSAFDGAAGFLSFFGYRNGSGTDPAA